MICINRRFSPVRDERALENHRDDTAGARQSDIVFCPPSPWTISQSQDDAADLHGCITLGLTR